jgi:hypothetical protein
MSSARLCLISSAIAVILVLSGPAQAERGQLGNVIVSLNGGIFPRELPRNHRAPVSVRLAGRVLTADQSPLPRVNWIRLELAWRGRLETKGLTSCPRARLESAESRLALQRCGDALVGRGQLFAQVFVPNQDAFDVRARALAFNGVTKEGRHAVLIHAYSTRPPASFVIPFAVHYNKGRTVLITTIRRSLGPWPRVANFQISVARTFEHDGAKRSYLSASCPVPKGFTAGFLSWARATYTFEGGKQITTESVRSCRAR